MCTIVTGVTVMAMKFMISDAHVRSHQSIAKTNVAYTTFKALHMIKQA